MARRLISAAGCCIISAGKTALLFSAAVGGSMPHRGVLRLLNRSPNRLWDDLNAVFAARRHDLACRYGIIIVGSQVWCNGSIFASQANGAGSNPVTCSKNPAMAYAIAGFFHNGLCPLCGGGFLRSVLKISCSPHRGTAADAGRPAAGSDDRAGVSFPKEKSRHGFLPCRDFFIWAV